MPSKVSLGAVIAATFIFATTTAPSTNGSPAAPSDDACSLLTQAQVTAAVSVPVGAGQYVGTYKKTCTWYTTDNAKPEVKYVTLLMQNLDAFQGGKQLPRVTIVPLSGVGDDAYYLAVVDQVGLIVKKASVAFKVAVYGRLPLERKEAIEKTLAQQVVSAL
jgi:hypothetical protein